MIINPAWRILTIGDGDLSFSASVWQHQKPAHLSATVLDSADELCAKYRHNQLAFLQQQSVNVCTGFDITDPTSWGEINNHQFDLVIFQFPLVPNFTDASDYQRYCQHISVNTLNRILLRQYLTHCFSQFLDPDGANLAVITSKDVKPYLHWQIDTTLTQQSGIHYIGKKQFEINQFPGYQIRNVDRDKHVKDTQGWSYFFSTHPEHSIKSELELPIDYQSGCPLCRVKHLSTTDEQAAHTHSKRHRDMLHYEQQWQWALHHHPAIKLAS